MSSSPSTTSTSTMSSNRHHRSRVKHMATSPLYRDASTAVSPNSTLSPSHPALSPGKADTTRAPTSTSFNRWVNVAVGNWTRYLSIVIKFLIVKHKCWLRGATIYCIIHLKYTVEQTHDAYIFYNIYNSLVGLITSRPNSLCLGTYIHVHYL